VKIETRRFSEIVPSFPLRRGAGLPSTLRSSCRDQTVRMSRPSWRCSSVLSATILFSGRRREPSRSETSGPRRPLLRLTNDAQALQVEPREVLIVSNQRHPVLHRSRRDPGITGFEAAAPAAGVDHDTCPLTGKVARVRQDHELSEEVTQALSLRRPQLLSSAQDQSSATVWRSSARVLPFRSGA
jgi:hypothetical protein